MSFLEFWYGDGLPVFWILRLVLRMPYTPIGIVLVAPMMTADDSLS